MVKLRYVIKIKGDYRNGFKDLYLTDDFDKKPRTDNINEAKIFPIRRAKEVYIYLKRGLTLTPEILSVKVTYKIEKVELQKPKTKEVQNGKSNQGYQV